MKKKWIKEIGLILLAMLISAALITSIPILDILIHGKAFKSEVKKKTEVKIAKVTQAKQEQKKARKLRKPKRSKPKSRSLKSGPRFALDLGVAGMGGVNVPSNLVNVKSGQGGGESGDVDNRPENNCPPNFELPQALREAEENAKVVIAFCVSETGKVYDMRVVEESPSGRGLAQAAQQAVVSSCFEPATKDGKALSFCGMEQPFEVRWND